MDNNEEKILFLEKRLSDLERLFNDHPHDGIGTKKIKYSNINDIPDAVVNDSDVVFTDITMGNASATKHGYLPKLPDDATKFLNGEGNFSTITYTCYASDDLRASADTERFSTSTDYEKKKEMTMTMLGTIRVKFDLKSTDGDGNVMGRIYKNDVAVGTERTTASPSYTTYSEDLSGVAVGDKIQIYIKRSSSSVYEAKIQNFRIYYNIISNPTVDTN